MPTASVPAPPSDARPIHWEQLTPEQQALVTELNTQLRGISERLPKWEPKADAPWALVNPERENRVFFLDGARGSGKTSLMLTLLAGWQQQWEPLGEQAKPPFEGVKLGVLPILDFDPLPPATPLLPWLLQAFLPLVKKLSKPASRPPDPEKPLLETWRDLSEALWRGWQRRRPLSPQSCTFRPTPCWSCPSTIWTCRWAAPSS